MQGVQVQSLIGELRSHMPCGQKNQNIKQKQYCNKFNKDLKKKKRSISKKKILKKENGTSLVVQWLRILLPMQGTRVQALVQEDPT